MTKKNIKLIDPKKILLIESSEFVSNVRLSNELKESIQMSAGKSGTLIVKNIPATVLNRLNQNGRIYSTQVVQKALDEAKTLLATRQLLSQAKEHPEGSFVAPTEASHVIINAYIKRNIRIVVEGQEAQHDVLFMDWLILNTREGKDLRALFEAECNIGSSIRGVGDMNGKYVENYELLGCDCVGNPSSSTYTRMPVSESVKVELVDPRDLKETFNVTTSSTNVVRDLEQASVLQAQLDNIGYGTVTKTSTKIDEETDPKTGAQTSITTLEAETSDDVTNLDQALMMAKNAILNGTVHIDSITIENIQEEQPKEAVEEYAPLSEQPITEAKEENNLNGKKFVLKAPTGYVGMEGNALVFKENPKEALHFITGKEESGLVHLSGVEKILDAMGVYDIVKHYQKDSTNIGVQDPTMQVEENQMMAQNMNKVHSSGEVDIGLVNEAHGSNTKFSAIVEIGGNRETIPVSAVDTEAIVAEVGNLWQMKAKGAKTQPIIRVIDTESNNEYIYNPQTNRLDGPNMGSPVQNSAVSATESSDLIQNDKKVSIDLGAGQTVEKDFDTSVQAAVAKRGIEQGKVDANVLMTDAVPEGDYLEQLRTLIAPYRAQAEQEVRGGILGMDNSIWWTIYDTLYEFDPELVNEYGTSKSGVSGLVFDIIWNDGQQEKVFSGPTDASDDFVEVPLQDAIKNVTVTLTDIEYNVDPDDPFDDLDLEDTEVFDTLNQLPETMTIELNAVDIPEHGDIRQAILMAAREQMGLNIKNATISDVIENI